MADSIDRKFGVFKKIISFSELFSNTREYKLHIIYKFKCKKSKPLMLKSKSNCKLITHPFPVTLISVGVQDGRRCRNRYLRRWSWIWRRKLWTDFILRVIIWKMVALALVWCIIYYVGLFNSWDNLFWLPVVRPTPNTQTNIVCFLGFSNRRCWSVWWCDCSPCYGGRCRE